jgi:hypothetical protein
MPNQSPAKISTFYLFTILLLMLIFPLISIAIDTDFFKPSPAPLLATGKWFLFWGIGMRLFTAGIRQSIKPEFTARNIFHITDKQSHVIVRELGFMNICLGLTAILSLFIPGWRIAAAFTGGLYMGIAGVQHVIKKPVSPNEVVAMVSDLFIFMVMGMYVGLSFQ